jgi:malate/lactate dehydrogenase
MSERSGQIASVGAGSVGATLAYACLLRGVARRIALYEIDKKKVESQALDLNHGLQFVAPAEAAAAGILEAILSDARAILPVSSLLENYGGLSDVCLSVPSVVNQSGVEPPLSIPMNAAEEAGLAGSARMVQTAIRALGF